MKVLMKQKEKLRARSKFISLPEAEWHVQFR